MNLSLNSVAPPQLLNMNLGRARRLIVLCAVALVFLALLPLAPARAAGLLVADGGFGGVLEIEEHSAVVTVNGGIAVTQVTQVFRNQENRIVEALYTFPVPEGATVANFSMWIAGKEMVGEVIEKERAREIYESYKQTRRDPGLLEQVDYKTFEMRIFPIAAGAEQRVEITYYQELDFDHDRATYVYPLATTTQEADSTTRGRFALEFDVRSEVPIVELTSPSHGKDFVVVAHNETYHQASLETIGGDLDRDLVLSYEVSRPFTGLDLLTSRTPGEDGFFQLTLTAGEELEQTTAPMDYVFVLDISGSMARDGKLALSRESVGAFLEGLSAEERFDVMAFNVEQRALFGELRSAGPSALENAQSALVDLSARGGTVLRPALERAYAYKDPDRFLNVVILSDGLTEQTERAALIASIGGRPSGTRVFCVGVGNEVNRPLLSQLAEDAGGLAAFVSRGDDLAQKARAFRRKLTRPAISNLEIQVDGPDVYDLESGTGEAAKLPDLFHGAPLVLYGRYAKSGPATVTVRGDLGGERFESDVALEFPKEDDTSPEIERMWAWHRIQGLLRTADRQGSRASVRDEIVRLGEGFSIVTEFTSFLVLENDAEYERWKIERRNALRFERDSRKIDRLRAELERLRAKNEQTLASLGDMNQDEAKAAERKAAAEAQPQATRTPAASPAGSEGPRRRSRAQSRDLFPGGGGGGGALDWPSALLALLLVGFALYASRTLR